MIRPLRRAHRRIVTAVAILLPALVLVALAGRRPDAVEDSLPAPLGEIPPAGLVAGGPLTAAAGVELRSGRSADGRRWIELRAREPLTHPDVLVYWSEPDPAGATAARLPPAARLLGVLSDTRTRWLPLPGAAAGELLFYSLAHDELVGRAPLTDGGTLLSDEEDGS